MTDEQIIKALQEGGLNEPEARQCLISRDAIVPVIGKRINRYELQHAFNYALYDLLPVKTAEGNGFTYVMAVLATPRELCIALLKATDSLVAKG